MTVCRKLLGNCNEHGGVLPQAIGNCNLQADILPQASIGEL